MTGPGSHRAARRGAHPDRPGLAACRPRPGRPPVPAHRRIRRPRTMHVRRATPADASAIRALAGDATAQMYDQVQASGAWLPALSLVALGPDGHITGHV